MMRAWILQSDASAYWEPIPGHLSSVEWTDATGDTADTCAVTIYGVDDGADVDKLLSDRLSLILTPPADPTVTDLLCYGPYDVDPASVDGEARAWRLTGRIGSHFEATIADAAAEAQLYVALQKAITETLAGSEPYTGWAAGSGAPDGAAAADYIVSPTFVWEQIQAQLVNARDLAGVRQVLKIWGLTAVPFPASVGPTGFRHEVRVEPLYRPATTGFAVASGLTVRLTGLGVPTTFGSFAAAGTLNLADDHLDAHPSIEWPDGLNRPDAFRRRAIIGIRRLFGANVDDNIILSAGTLRPPVYLEADTGPNLLKQREEVERWTLQNESAVITAVRRFATPYTDVATAFITPYQLAIVGDHQLPPGDHGKVWQVRQVRHAWDEEQGYRQTIKSSLWQGSFSRTTGSSVREFPVGTSPS